MDKVRNFCIIAHIDHGKSTLADRFLEVTQTLSKRDMKRDQMLDTMELEQERGITIKLQPARMAYQGYTLNLIDTPGHVDFSYEVSRSLAAVEGAILLVDCTQGIQAQTLANTYLALEHDLTIIPVLNKIDLPGARVEEITKELVNTLGFKPEEILTASGKTGEGVPEILQTIIDRIPPPQSTTTETQAMIFDSVFDSYQGVITYIRVMNGQIKKNDKLILVGTGAKAQALEIGHLIPDRVPTEVLKTGEIGYLVTGLKEVGQARVGDTITLANNPAPALPGYRQVTPFVYAGIFTTAADDYPTLRDALEKLALNDSSLLYTPETSTALGFGFRCGFLGLLHMEIIQERLEREYDLDLIFTAPNVAYDVILKTGDKLHCESPAAFPDRSAIESIEEPIVKLDVLSPSEYIGAIMELCDKKRGAFKNMEYLDNDRVNLKYHIPLASIVVDFYDQLKSSTQGYASISYEPGGYEPADLVKLDILVAGDPVDALASIIHKDDSYSIGSALCKKLKDIIPRQQFPVALQSAIGSKIISRETIPAFRKDVIAGLYGGDRSRKDKLLKKQKKGKKRMKNVGQVNIPQEAFLAVLKR